MPKIVAMDPKKVHTYISRYERDVDSDEQTKFKVRLLTVQESARIKDDLYQVSGVGRRRQEKLRTGTSELETLKLCLKGWDNLLDAEGNQVPYSHENFSQIPPEIRSEIADYVSGEVQENEATETEKKSGLQSDGLSS